MNGKQNIAVSVIVPVYKAEGYLRRCIDSIISQEFPSFEVILVDDGSPDKSGTICDLYAEKCPSVHVVHKKNEGSMLARKTGFSVAKGEFIMFVDSDDSLQPGALSKLYSKSMGTDIVIGFPYIPLSHPSYNLEQCRDMILRDKLPRSVFAKLYRRSLIEENDFIIPQEIMDMGEDLLLNIHLFFRTHKNPRFVYEKIYNYNVDNEDSMMHQKTKKKTLISECAFDNTLRSYIPMNEIDRYMPSILFIRMNGLRVLAINEPEKFKGNEFVEIVKTDIERYHYPLNIFQRLILYSPVSWLKKLSAYLIGMKGMKLSVVINRIKKHL
jgi:glycosyltransferase involved in cell wall biosynthesis